MVNQDPQPELYTTRHEFTTSNSTGDISTVTVYTNQANNEECRIYAILVDILDENGTPASTSTTEVDFGITLQVGPNNIPTNEFDATTICFRDDKQLAFPSPILHFSSNPWVFRFLNSTTESPGCQQNRRYHRGGAGDPVRIPPTNLALGSKLQAIDINSRTAE